MLSMRGNSKRVIKLLLITNVRFPAQANRKQQVLLLIGSKNFTQYFFPN